MESKTTEFKNKTILVVDDSSMNRKLVIHILKPKGVHILTAENGKEALTVLREQSPHLVLMDIQMPVMDGYEATRQAKADPATASIPIIALTGGDTKEEYERCLEAGCDAYLTKPISQLKLFKTIADFLPAQSSSENDSPSASLEVEHSWIIRIAEAIQNEYVPQLKELLTKDEPTALRRFGHTMKGLGRQFQLNSLAEWGDNFEKSAETLPSDALRQQVEQFETVASNILDATALKADES